MCGEVSLTKVMSLTPTPPGNDFLKQEELGRDEQSILWIYTFVKVVIMYS